MRTPRPTPAARRGIATLIGNGWGPASFEEPQASRVKTPRPVVADQKAFHAGIQWDQRGRSLMRKCIFMEVPPQVRDLPAPPVSPAAMPRQVYSTQPSQQSRHHEPVVPHRHKPERDVKMFPAYSSNDEVLARKRADLYAAEKAKLLGRRREAAPHPASSTRARWYEDPIAVGTLLLMLPPIGLAAVWTSKRYSNDARWALTVVTGLMMCLGGAIAVALLIR